METIFEMVNREFVLSLALLGALTVLLIYVFVHIVIVIPIRDDVPYKYWHWTWIVVRQVLPGAILLTAITLLLVGTVGPIVCKHQWNQGEYQIAEGELTELTVEEIRRSGSTEPSYDCSFRVGGVFFPATNDYTAEQVEALEESTYVKVYYLYDGDSPWPWQIDVETAE